MKIKQHTPYKNITFCCRDCGTKISWVSALHGQGGCKSCSSKGKHPSKETRKKLRESSKGKNNGMYVDGRSCIKRYCVDCGRLVSRNSKNRCQKCHLKFSKGVHHPQYKGGKPKCVDCGKELSTYGCLRCSKCFHKTQIKITKNYCCVDCGNLISYPTAIYGNGRCVSCKAQGNLHPLFGSKMTVLVKSKISSALIGRFTGTESPNYIHGESNYPHPLEFNNNLKLKIRERDNHTCQSCEVIETKHRSKSGRGLSVHHIDYIKENCTEDNLISLCDSCHSKSNRNRDYWFAYYTFIMENRQC